MRARPALRAAGVLLGALLLSATTPALQGPAAKTPGAVAKTGSPETTLVEILRRARSEEDPSYADLSAQAAELGTAAIRPSLHLLESERVPPLTEQQEEQVLSQPQRGVLLDALERLDPGAVRRALDERLAQARDVPGRLLALRVLGVAGDASSLQQMLKLAQAEDETEPPARLEQALREAAARILKRSPDAFEGLPKLLAGSPDALRAAWVQAAGDSGSPRALELCSYVFSYQRDLASVASAQILRVGRSPRPEVNRDLIQSLRALVDATQPVLCRSVLLALGELRDYDSIPALIGLLDGSDAGLVQNAGWALRRITGLSFPDDVPCWRRWYATELAWFQHEEHRVLRDLASNDPAKVSAALREIGRRRTHREELATEVLDVLSRPEPTLRAQACNALGLLGAELAESALLERMETDIPYCAQAAWRALANISGLELPADGQAWREALYQGT